MSCPSRVNLEVRLHLFLRCPRTILLSASTPLCEGQISQVKRIGGRALISKVFLHLSSSEKFVKPCVVLNNNLAIILEYAFILLFSEFIRVLLREKNTLKLLSFEISILQIVDFYLFKLLLINSRLQFFDLYSSPLFHSYTSYNL